MSVERTALFGPSTLAGKDLLERLGADRARLGRLSVAEAGGEEAIATPVGDEWMVSTPLMDEALEGADLVLCCSRPPPAAAEALRAAAAHAVVIDLAGGLGGAAFDAARGATLASLGHGLHASPGASALVLAALARAARAAGGVALSAVALEPASELGRDAVNEMIAQAMALLSFQPMPTAVFGRQAVHDAFSPGLSGEEVEARLRRHVRELDGGEVPVLVVRPGTFHGIALAVHAGVAAAAWRAALAAEKRLALDEDREGGVSPASSVLAEAALVGRIVDDGSGGAWAWAAADSLAHGAVGNVVDLVRAS